MYGCYMQMCNTSYFNCLQVLSFINYQLLEMKQLVKLVMSMDRRMLKVCLCLCAVHVSLMGRTLIAQTIP